MNNINKSKDLIINSLDFFDKNKEKYSKLISKIKYFTIIRNTNDMDRNIIVCYDNDKNEIFKSEFEYSGTYYSSTNTWIWSWAIPIAPKNSTYLAKKIVNYGMDLDYMDNRLLKTELITSRFKITNSIQLDIHIAISAYIAKIPFIMDIYNVIDISKKNDDAKNVENIENIENKSNSKYYKFYTADKVFENNLTYERYSLFIMNHNI